MQNKKLPSKSSWLVAAIIVFVLGAVVCGTGSAVMVWFAAALTLPAVLSKRRTESGCGAIILLFCLLVGASIYSKQGLTGAYWEYLQRAKVASAIQWLEQLKSPVETFYATHHNCPTPAQIGAKTSSKYVANLQRSGADGEKCIYTVVSNTDMGFVANTTLGLAYLIKSNTWSCKNKDTASTQIDPIYLPYRCKD